MRIFITGGSGCLGRNIIDAFLPEGHDILILDNFATSSGHGLPSGVNFEVIEGSVADSALVGEIFSAFRPTHVIHAAAAYKNPQDWLEDIATNTSGTANIIKNANAHNIKRLVYFQTALCYGRPQQMPIPETHQLAPITSYGISKTAGERLLALAEVPWISFRLANVVAPGLSIGPLPTFYQRLKSGKACYCSDAIRDFLDISDFLAILRLALKDDAPTGIFNVSTGRGYSIREVYDAVAAYLGGVHPEPPIVPCAPDDVPAVVLDPQLAVSCFGWKPRVSFAAMTEKMLRWYDEHGVGEIHSHLAKPQPEATDAH